MNCYSINLRTRKYVKEYGFYHPQRQWLNTRLNSLKIGSEKVVHKTG